MFLALQNRQSQKQTEQANNIARAEFSGKMMRTHRKLHGEITKNIEPRRAFYQLTIENKPINDPETLFGLLIWFSNYAVLWMELMVADEKGLVDEEVARAIYGTWGFYLTFPAVWQAMASNGKNCSATRVRLGKF